MQAIRKIGEVARNIKGATLENRVHALYRGSIIPFSTFYAGDNDNQRNAERVADIYDALNEGREGVRIGDARRVGAPRLFRFVPSQTTIELQGARGLTGDALHRGRLTYLSKLIFTEKGAEPVDIYADLASDLEAYRADPEKQNQRAGIYVMACPFIDADKEGKSDLRHAWDMTFWAVNDIASQIALPSRKAVKRVERQLELI